MSEITPATAQSSIATVENQIAERIMELDSRRRKIRSYRDAIEAENEGIALAQDELKRLRARAKIFRRAAFQLSEVDKS